MSAKVLMASMERSSCFFRHLVQRLVQLQEELQLLASQKVLLQGAQGQRFQLCHGGWMQEPQDMLVLTQDFDMRAQEQCMGR